MSTNKTNPGVYLPRINAAAVEQYKLENPGELDLPLLTKRERQTLLSFGITAPAGCVRFPVLGTGSAKTTKGEKKGWKTGICYLTPAKKSGFFNACPWAGNCRKPCLDTAGRGQQTKTQKARRRKTFRFAALGVECFLVNAALDLIALIRTWGTHRQYGIAVRLDGTSDMGLAAHRLAIFNHRSLAEVFPGCNFYEYTKSENRMLAFLAGALPINLHLTFSYDGERNEEASRRILAAGGNVAAVFHPDIPSEFLGVETINGDETDLRFLDPFAPTGAAGVVVALKAKGKAKHDFSGFVVRP